MSMEIDFEELLPLCEGNKKAQSLCKKLIKKFSWTRRNDSSDCMDLAYWLFVLGQTEGAKKIISVSHDVPIRQDKKYTTAFDAVIILWGLESWILKQEGKKEKAEERIEAINAMRLDPGVLDKGEDIDEKKHGTKRRRTKYTHAFCTRIF